MAAGAAGQLRVKECAVVEHVPILVGRHRIVAGCGGQTCRGEARRHASARHRSPSRTSDQSGDPAPREGPREPVRRAAEHGREEETAHFG